MSRLNGLFGDNVRLCKVLGDSLGKQGASFESSSAKSRPEITSESALIPAQSCTVAASRTSMLSFPGERSSVQLRVPSKFLAHVKHPSKRVASVSPCPLTNYFQRRYSKSRTAGQTPSLPFASFFSTARRFPANLCRIKKTIPQAPPTARGRPNSANHGQAVIKGVGFRANAELASRLFWASQQNNTLGQNFTHTASDEGQ